MNFKKKNSISDVGKTFVMTGALTSHMRKHNNTMTQCPCPTCGKIFNRPGALADHVRVHTGNGL